MRKLAGILAVTAFVMGTATAVFSGPLPATGVFKSPHDMNTKGQVDSMERTCVFCHTPHNATPDDTGVNTYPPWNHTLPSTTGWQNYVWAAPLNSGLNTSDPLAGPSRLCMSCHDGVTAFDTHNGAIAQAGGTKLSGAKAVGRNSDLTDDHPIGFSYGDALTARNIAAGPTTVGTTELALKTDGFATAVAASAAAGTYDTVTRNGKRKVGDVLYNGDTVTCASCHDVHNKDNAVITTSATANYFLWADQKDSLICLSCHLK